VDAMLTMIRKNSNEAKRLRCAAWRGSFALKHGNYRDF
jgi:hypothetical protein